MIRIERGLEVAPGIWEYSIPSLRLFGKSRQPMLDACRRIKAMGAGTGERVGIFRDGRSEPDMSCLVEVGARYTVKERASGGIRFEKFEEVDPSVFKTKEAEVLAR
jgi:hypothetical protein